MYLFFDNAILANIATITTRFSETYDWNTTYSTNLHKITKKEPFTLVHWDNLIQSACSIKIERVVTVFLSLDDESEYERDLILHFNELYTDYIQAKDTCLIKNKEITDKREPFNIKDISSEIHE